MPEQPAAAKRVQRGDVVLVAFPFAAGGAAKLRPALIVQNDGDNQRLANTMRRLLEAVGLQRRPRDVTPHLRQYLNVRAELASESNVTGPSPVSSGAGNRAGEAPSHDAVPLEGNQDGAE